MNAPILLDTCAAIWSTGDTSWSPAGEAAIAEANRGASEVFVSPITAWELGLLVAKGRLALRLPPKLWFAGLLASGARLAPLTPDIFIESSSLPGDLHGDPADRILAATARACGYRLMTRDKPLLAYGEAGHLQTIPC